MRLGIVGLPGSGKSTIFDALARSVSDPGHKKGDRIATIRVPDERIDVLNEIYKREKKIYAQLEYFLPKRKGAANDPSIWNPVRDCTALIPVIRNFGGFGFEAPTPANDFNDINQEMILTDLVVVEKRLERLALDKQRGKKINPEEPILLTQCLKTLEKEIPLRQVPDLMTAKPLKGYAFITAKPILVLFNNEDDDEVIPDFSNNPFPADGMVIRGKLEQELAHMSEEESIDFLSEFNISASATDRVIKKSYETLGLISFFTVGDKEVKAWTIRKETSAIDAAENVHTDIKKGFIRAEVLAFDDLMSCGSYQEAKKKGVARLEGKTYEVKNGDIINFRFNV